MSTQIEITKNIVNYLSKNGYRSDPIIDELVKETNELGSVAQMQIAPEQGQFLEMIVRLIGAKNCLEIGRFTGLSALCIAKGLTTSGKVVTIDNSNEFLAVAEKYWKKKGVRDKIESVIGEGVEVLQSLIDRQNYFDLVFIDADKNNYNNYYELSLKLIPSNGLIIIDNMLWGGEVADPIIIDKSTVAIRTLNKKILEDTRVEFCLLPLADGLSFIRKK
jgi:predicted O-methyltransferase YrrM